MAPPAIFGRKIFHRDPVVKPMGQCREDWQIILEIGCALGFEEECYGGSVEAALDDMYRGAGIDISLELLREHPEGYEVPGGSKDEKKYETGGLRKDGQPGFNTNTGKCELYNTLFEAWGFDPLPYYEEPPTSPWQRRSSPRSTRSCSRAAAAHGSSSIRRPPDATMRELHREPLVIINPRTAERFGIARETTCGSRTIMDASANVLVYRLR